MFEKLFVKTSDLVFHTIAPYSVERERFLEHCCEEGFGKAALRLRGRVSRRSALRAADQAFGSSTLSMTWITPFDWSTSAMVTVATPPVSSVSVILSPSILA